MNRRDRLEEAQFYASLALQRLVAHERLTGDADDLRLVVDMRRMIGAVDVRTEALRMAAKESDR